MCFGPVYGNTLHLQELLGYEAHCLDDFYTQCGFSDPTLRVLPLHGWFALVPKHFLFGISKGKKLHKLICWIDGFLYSNMLKFSELFRTAHSSTAFLHADGADKCFLF